MADRLVQDGYLDVGYEFVNVDDCWPAMERDSQGRLQANSTRFPRGIKWLAQYVSLSCSFYSKSFSSVSLLFFDPFLMNSKSNNLWIWDNDNSCEGLMDLNLRINHF